MVTLAKAPTSTFSMGFLLPTYPSETWDSLNSSLLLIFLSLNFPFRTSLGLMLSFLALCAMLVGAIFHPLWNNWSTSPSYTQICNNNNTQATHTSLHDLLWLPSTHRIRSILYSTFVLRSNPGPHPMPVSAHPAHVRTPAQSAPCLFPAQAGLLSISERLLVLSSGLNALVPIPFPSGCQHILQNGLKSSHTRTIVLITSVSRFWSFQTAQIKNPAWPLFFLLTPDSWGPLCTNGVSYRELCVC